MIGRRLFSPLRIATLVGVLVSILRLTGCEYPDLADLRAMDYRLLQRGVQPGARAVVIVAVDDRSVATIGRWPWPRPVVARLVDQLTAADAAVIGFDIVQSEATADHALDGLRERVEGIDETTWATLRRALGEMNSDDRILASAIRESNRVALGYFFEFDQGAGAPSPAPHSGYNLERPSASGRGESRVPQAAGVRANLPEMTAAARETGFFNIFPSPDGSVRSVPLVIRFNQQLAVPLALAMLRAYQPGQQLEIEFAEFGVRAVRVGGVSVPVDEDGQMLVNYRGPKGTFEHVSAVDVLAGRVEPDTFRGKLVLVGVTATAVADVRVIAFDGVFPGVETHANVLDNILRRDFIARPRWVRLAEVGVILTAVLALAAVLRLVRGVAGALVAAAFLGGYLVASQWAFISTGYLLSVVYPLLAIAVTQVAIAVQQYTTEAREKREIRRAFGLYLPPALARLVSEQPDMLKLGGDKRELTVLFSDIRGFTATAERLPPETLVELLNVYLGEMTDVIFARGGMLDKYIGDAVMAVWGAPVPQADHAERACLAALDMVARLRTLQATWLQRGWPVLAIGVGLNTGEMIVGNMGSARRLSYTVIGDNVNLGSRLEGLNKLYGSQVIASEATVRAANGAVIARELDLVRVLGRASAVRIFEILGPANERPHWADVVERFEAGVAAYRARRWREAVAAFTWVVEKRPGDMAAALYVSRCQALLHTPPGEDWDGVTDVEHK